MFSSDFRHKISELHSSEIMLPIKLLQRRGRSREVDLHHTVPVAAARALLDAIDPRLYTSLFSLRSAQRKSSLSGREPEPALSPPRCFFIWIRSHAAGRYFVFGCEALSEETTQNCLSRETLLHIAKLFLSYAHSQHPQPQYRPHS